jgi:phosphatidylserine decarboxylase
MLCGFVGLCFMVFFRDPERQIPVGEGLVLSPADGRVLVADRATEAGAPVGSWLQVSIFLSPLDVHINRVPVSGRVSRIEHRPGRFLPAYKPEAGANERTEFSIDAHGQTIIVRQIVGVLARRVVCRLAEGNVVSAGDRFGLMKFGSRMDVFLPPTADLRVRAGDRVRGGETVLALLKN